MFFWPMAANEPSSIEASAMKATICCQSCVTWSSAPRAMRTNTAMPAILGAAAKKAVIGVGAPS